MRILIFFIIICLLFNGYACTRTLTKADGIDLGEPILEGKARFVTTQNGHDYELCPPNTYTVVNDTLHFMLKKTGPVIKQI